MKNYVVGDIQGCYKGLKSLLKSAKFRPGEDKLWAVGDLIARGPDSLSTMEFVKDMGPHFDTVLGNHDLHLIAAAHGVSKVKPQDKLSALMKSKKFDTYVDFLLEKPLAIRTNKNTLISHAGLYPGWSMKRAVKMSKKIQKQLQGKNPTAFFERMYGNYPNIWSKDLSSEGKEKFAVNALTRMRYIDSSLALEFTTKTHPRNAPAHISPWFDVHNPKTTEDDTIIFGHWASLLGQIPKKIASPAKVIALDTGYVWGNKMTLYCLETQETISVSA